MFRSVECDFDSTTAGMHVTVKARSVDGRTCGGEARSPRHTGPRSAHIAITDRSMAGANAVLGKTKARDYRAPFDCSLLKRKTAPAGSGDRAGPSLVKTRR